MVNGHLAVPALDAVTPPSSKAARDQRRKQQQEARHAFFRRVYGGSKAVIQSKVLDVGMELEEDHDYSTVVIDQDGLPQTYSDLGTVNLDESMHSLIEQEIIQQEEQDLALGKLLEASKTVSNVSFRQKHYRYSSSSNGSESTDRSKVSVTDHPGPNSLEELRSLRAAVDNLSEAFHYADPRRGRKLRRQYESSYKGSSVESSPESFRIPSLKRKSLPDYDCPVDIIAPEDINPYLVSPEPREELTSFVTSPLMMRTPKIRGVFTARALRKLEVDDVSSGDSSEEEDRSIAHYYISKHRANRKNEVKAVSYHGSKKEVKAARRRTSIMGNRNELKSHLLIQSEGFERHHRDINANFLDALDDEHRRATAPPSLIRHEEKGSSNGERRSSSFSDSSTNSWSADSSQDSDSPTSALISFHSSTTLVDEDELDPINKEKDTWPSSLSSLSPTSVYFSSEEESESPTSHLVVISKRCPSMSQPPRPKRHPLRPENLSMTRLDGSNESVFAYSTLTSSSDVTPRPGALTFGARIAPLA